MDNNSWNNSCNNSCNGCNCNDNGCQNNCNNCSCNNGNSGGLNSVWVPIIAIALLGGFFGSGSNNQCR